MKRHLYLCTEFEEHLVIYGIMASINGSLSTRDEAIYIDLLSIRNGARKMDGLALDGIA